MNKKIITSPNVPAALGPYSQAVQAGNMFFASGMLAIDPITGELVGETAAEQAEQVIKNIHALLTDASLTSDNVVKTTVFLADMADFAAINEVYSKYFTKYFPARSCIAVKGLPKNAKIEIELIAIC